MTGGNGHIPRQAAFAPIPLEEIGCVRTTFETVSIEVDRWGRSTSLLRAHGSDIKFTAPAGYEMLGLPARQPNRAKSAGVHCQRASFASTYLIEAVSIELARGLVTT